MTKINPVKAASPEREALDRVSAYIAEFKPRCYSDNAGMARRTAFQEIEDLISSLFLPVQSVEGPVAWTPELRRTLAVDVANRRQGQSSTPRCESPGEADIRIAAFWVGLTLDALADRQPLYAAPPKPSEADQFAQDAKCSTPAGQEYETALRILTDMDAENMPIEKRAAILGSMIARPTDADRAWAVEMAKGLPEAHVVGHLNLRGIALAALERQRQAGESKEMAACWIASDIRKALAASTPEIAGQGDACEFCDKPLPHDKCRPEPALGEREITTEMVERAARAHDQEESAQKGEPSPWTHFNCDDGDVSEVDCEDCKAFREERLSTMRAALTAALSTTTSTKGVE